MLDYLKRNIGEIKTQEELSPTISSTYYKGPSMARPNLILADRTRTYADKGRNLESPKQTTNALSGVQKDNLLIANTVDVDGYLRRGARDRDKNGKAILTSIPKRRIRRLTPKECERLQGFPDGWTEMVSDTQRYKAMGNAVSVPVIEAIGRKILECVA